MNPSRLLITSPAEYRHILRNNEMYITSADTGAFFIVDFSISIIHYRQACHTNNIESWDRSNFGRGLFWNRFQEHSGLSGEWKGLINI